MIAVIGEMAVSFRRDGNIWNRSYSGLGYSWAVSLKEKGESVVLFSVLPAGRTGKEMAEELVRKQILFDPDMLTPLNPAFEIDGEWFMKGSAPAAMETEKLSDAFTYFGDIQSIVISSRLLSYNPASSAVLDAVSFLSPFPKVFIDASAGEDTIGQKAILERTLREFSQCVPGTVIASDPGEILSALR